MKTVLALLFVISVGVGQTKIDSALTITGTGEFVILEKPTWHYQWGTIDHEGKVEFSDNFWLAFAAKWREYESWCYADSVQATYHRIPAGGRYDFVPCNDPTHVVTEWVHATPYFSDGMTTIVVEPYRRAKESFILWLERKSATP